MRMGARRQPKSDKMGILMESLDRLGVGYYQSDADGRIVAVNRAGAAMYGYTPEEMTSGMTTLETNISAEEREKLMSAPECDGLSTSMVFPGRHRNGSVIFVNTCIHKRTDSRGRFLGYEGIFNDATEKVLLLRRQEVYVKELQHANEQLSLMNAFQEQFLSAISHDVQTPPVIIQGFTELLLKGHYGKITPEQEKPLRTMHRNNAVLVEMMQQLLDFSRLLRGIREGGSRAVPFGDSLGRILAYQREEMARLGVGFVMDPPPKSQRVDADGPGLDYLLQNILSNACYMAKPGSVIAAFVKTDAAFVEFEVAADSLRLGLPAPHQIMQRFFVPSPSESGGQAEGPLGLAAGKYLARLFQGNLALAVDGASGVRIRLTLPLAPGQNQEAAAERSNSASTPKETAAKKRSRRRA